MDLAERVAALTRDTAAYTAAFDQFMEQMDMLTQAWLGLEVALQEGRDAMTWHDGDPVLLCG